MSSDWDSWGAAPTAAAASEQITAAPGWDNNEPVNGSTIRSTTPLARTSIDASSAQPMNPAAPVFEQQNRPSYPNNHNGNPPHPQGGGWGVAAPAQSASGTAIAPISETLQLAPLTYSQAVPMPAPTFVDRNGSVISRMSDKGQPSSAVTGWFDGPTAAGPAAGHAAAKDSVNDRKRDGTSDSGYHSPAETMNKNPSQDGIIQAPAQQSSPSQLRGSQASQWAHPSPASGPSQLKKGVIDEMTSALSAASFRERSRTPVPSVAQQQHQQQQHYTSSSAMPPATAETPSGSVGWGDPDEVAAPAPISNGWGGPDSSASVPFQASAQTSQAPPPAQNYTSSDGWGAAPAPAPAPIAAAGHSDSNGWAAVSAPRAASQNGYGPDRPAAAHQQQQQSTGYGGGGMGGGPRSNGFGSAGGPPGAGFPPRSGLGAVAPCLTGTNSIQLRKNRWGAAKRSEEEHKAMLEATEAEFGNLYSNVSSFDRYGYGDRGYGDDSGYNQDASQDGPGGDQGQSFSSGAGGGHGW